MEKGFPQEIRGIADNKNQQINQKSWGRNNLEKGFPQENNPVCDSYDTIKPEDL